MQLIPAIDLMGGKIVRLTRGDPKTAKTYEEQFGTPLEAAKRWRDEGAGKLHIIDLDAAFGKGDNYEVISEIAANVELPIQVGGGIRSFEIASKLFKTGIKQVILGSLAFSDPACIRKIRDRFGADSVIVALDNNKDGLVMTQGWKNPKGFIVKRKGSKKRFYLKSLNVQDALEMFTGLFGVERFLITSTVQDGMLSGPDLNTLSKAVEFPNAKIIAAGGISSIKDLAVLKEIGVEGVVIGKALYEGHFTLKEALQKIETKTMPLAKRIVPCLDVDHGKVVKCINFLNPKCAGDPVEMAKRYSDEGADELVFLDITASHEKREIMRKYVEGVANAISIPFTVGGGIRNVSDARNVLCSGADKVSINTAAVENPKVIAELAEVFGRQCVVIAIDARRNRAPSDGKIMVETGEGKLWFEVVTYGGRKPTGIDALAWAMQAEKLGAGEFLVTSMDKDGTKDGYDIELTRAISERVNVPIIASGGAGEPKHLLEVLTEGKADAALAASIFHYNNYPLPVVKDYLRKAGVTIRQ